MVLKHSLIALVFALPAFAQQPLYAQCGGIGWTGGTTCVSGASCQKINDYYSQCLPGGSTTAPTTAPTTVPPTTTSGGDPAPTGCPPINTNPVTNSKLPDPFTFSNGARVTTKADWACRRAELLQLIQRFEMGTLPPKPQSVTSSLSGNTLSITASDSGKSISFSVTISKPSGTGPFPALIAFGGMSIPTPSGVAVITFNNNDIAAQDDASSRGKGKFYTLYGTGHSAGAMTAWAWGISRIIDALEQNPSANINLQRIGVTGCSRNGKGALVAGAFDTRIALTIPQESGSGGGGCWRVSDAMLKSGINTQTASEIVGENVWFSPSFNQYSSPTQVTTLPFDHHLLSALVAPRGLLVIDNTSIDWLGPQSVWGCQKTANKVWQALGVADAMGVSQIGNHNHCAFPSSQQGDIIRTDGANNVGFVEANWVSWTVPTLS